MSAFRTGDGEVGGEAADHDEAEIDHSIADWNYSSERPDPAEPGVFVALLLN